MSLAQTTIQSNNGLQSFIQYSNTPNPIISNQSDMFYHVQQSLNIIHQLIPNLTAAINTVSKNNKSSNTKNQFNLSKCLPKKSEPHKFFYHFKPPPFSAPAINSSTNNNSLQHALTEALHTYRFQQYKTELNITNNKRKSALLNSVTASGANLWLESVPITPETTLWNSQFNIAIRLRLGVPCHEIQSSKCVLCNTSNGDFRIDPFHYLSCPKLKSRQITKRHNSIARVLTQYSNRAGFHSEQEPPHLSTIDGKRPDILFIADLHSILVDVCVSHPLACSYIDKVANDTFYASNQAIKVKQTKYSQLAIQQKAKFIPFAVETLGGIHPQAAQLLNQIATASRDFNGLWSDTEIIKSLKYAVACSIQKGNSDTILAGYQHAAQIINARNSYGLISNLPIQPLDKNQQNNSIIILQDNTENKIDENPNSSHNSSTIPSTVNADAPVLASIAPSIVTPQTESESSMAILSTPVPPPIHSNSTAAVSIAHVAVANLIAYTKEKLALQPIVDSNSTNIPHINPIPALVTPVSIPKPLVRPEKISTQTATNKIPKNSSFIHPDRANLINTRTNNSINAHATRIKASRKRSINSSKTSNNYQSTTSNPCSQPIKAKRVKRNSQTPNLLNSIPLCNSINSNLSVITSSISSSASGPRTIIGPGTI